MFVMNKKVVLVGITFVIFLGSSLLAYHKTQTRINNLKINTARLFTVYREGVSGFVESQYRYSKELDERIIKLEGELKKKTEKISIIEESVDPKNFRWAKIKKVRAAVQQTIKDHKYKQHLSTQDLTTYASAVVDWSEQYDVSIPLILAMTRQESAFNALAVSHAGAQGIIQVMPSTAKEIAYELGVRNYNMLHVRDNIRFGTYYIMKMLNEFEGDVSLAVRAYNAGPTYVRKVIGGEYEDYPKETRHYVTAIMGTEQVDGFIKYYQKMGL